MQTNMDKLRAALHDAAAEFSDDASALSGLLDGMLADVERAWAEPLEIVPVAHHSPACALHMLRRLQARAPRVIYMELCEDLQQLLPKLDECQFPVALQAFAADTDAFPPDWAPLTVVAPITEFSAEFQAIAYAAARDDVELVFVDRSVDHVFQMIPQEEGALDALIPEVEDKSGKKDNLSHGSALGLQMGSVVPSFDAFLEFLLRNANVRHFAEWWDQYVEQALLEADYARFRQVMYLVGSLMRRLGTRPEMLASNRWRERYMWTRIKDHMAANDVAPEDAIYICGAAHSISDVEEYGAASTARFDIPEKTPTSWLYGLIPSSYTAIEHQFGHPPGTVSIAEANWKKWLTNLKLKPFRLTAEGAKLARRKPTGELAGEEDDLSGFLSEPPPHMEADQEQLLAWCVRIVKLARDNGYLATTADSIAIYQTSMLLANMRNRAHPSPYDFRDAAVTCLEKSRVPKKRDIPWLCDMLLGGDRTGKVGYSSMPPLARDVFDRLKVLPVNVNSSTVQRALMDFKQHPEYLPASDLLWKLHYLLEGWNVVRPIMGERALGKQPLQESWDLSIGKNQRAVIQLGYEGVTVEQVLELRLKKRAFGDKATTIDALAATEDSILFLKSRRLTEELGMRAVELLREEVSAATAPEIFERVRRLVHYYRSRPDGLAYWIEDFVSSGYQHYATLLPEAFADGDTSPEEISGMLGFIFTLESLAISLGCDRSQLLIAINQSDGLDAITPDKIGLLWSAQYLLGERDVDTIRAFFDEALGNPFMVNALPDYVGGFVLALRFTPLVGRLVVELLSKAFARLPDRILMPWLPGLIMALKPMGADLMPTLIKEASLVYPRHARELDAWEAPWERAARAPAAQAAEVPAGPELTLGERQARALLFEHRGATDAMAAALGAAGEWVEALPAAGAVAPAGPQLVGHEAGARALLVAHRGATDAMAAALGASGEWVESLGAASGAPATAPATGGGAVGELLGAHPATLEALAERLG